MRFSKEQKEILYILYENCQRGDEQPESILFKEIISKILPSDCHIDFDKQIGSIILIVKSEEHNDSKSIDKISGMILTYIFLVHDLVKNNLIFTYKPYFISDDKPTISENKNCNHKYNTHQFIFGPTLAQLAETYDDSVLHPSYTLIEYIRNKFKTLEELDSERNMSLAIKGLNRSIWAIFISVLALLISGIIEFSSFKISKDSLYVNKKSLKYDEVSSTEDQQEKLKANTDTIIMELRNAIKPEHK